MMRFGRFFRFKYFLTFLYTIHKNKLFSKMPHSPNKIRKPVRRVFGIIEDRFYETENFNGSSPRDYKAWTKKGPGIPAKIEHGHRQFGKVTDVKIAPKNNYLLCEMTFDNRLPAADDAWRIIQNKNAAKQKIGLSFNCRAIGDRERNVREPYHEIREVSLVDDPVVDNGFAFAIQEGDRLSVSRSMGYHLAKTMLKGMKMIDIKNSKYSLPENCVNSTTNFSKNKDSLLLSHPKKMEGSLRNYNDPEWRAVLDNLEVQKPSDLAPLKEYKKERDQIKKQREARLEVQFKDIAGYVEKHHPEFIEEFSSLDFEEEAKRPVVYDFIHSMLVGTKRPTEVATQAAKSENEDYNAVAQKQQEQAAKKRTFASAFTHHQNQHSPSDVVPVFNGEKGSNLQVALEAGLTEGARMLYKEELQEKDNAEAQKDKRTGKTMAAYFS